MTVEAEAPELDTETDADLLARMATAEEGPGSARAAWGVFYARHVGYVWGVCLRAYGDILGGEVGVADLVSEVFRMAYENAGKFDPAGICDGDRLRRRARAWLGWVARRLAQDTLRRRGRLSTVGLAPANWAQVPGADRSLRRPSARERAVREAVFSLSEREQLVIRTTFQWYRPEKDHQRLPNEVACELAETLGTTPENLRQIRRRALRKVAEFLRQRGDAERSSDG